VAGSRRWHSGLGPATAWRAAQHPARIHIRSGEYLDYIYVCMYIVYIVYIYICRRWHCGLGSATAWRAAQHPAPIYIRTGQHLVYLCMHVCMYNIYIFIHLYIYIYVCVGVGTVVWALHSATAWRAAQHPARIHVRPGEYLDIYMYVCIVYIYLFIYIYM